MSDQATPARVFFQPLPEHDNLNTAYFLVKVADRVILSASGCWEWTGNKLKRDYGRIDHGGRKYVLHRIIYRLCVGSLPPGRVEVCHSCDNPPCCNPAHLFLGTHAENMRDSEAKGRNSHRAQKGQEKPQAKLTEEAVRDIRRRVAAGENGRIIAEDHGVSRATVSEIARRKKWRHVP